MTVKVAVLSSAKDKFRLTYNVNLQSRSIVSKRGTIIEISFSYPSDHWNSKPLSNVIWLWHPLSIFDRPTPHHVFFCNCLSVANKVCLFGLTIFKINLNAWWFSLYPEFPYKNQLFHLFNTNVNFFRNTRHQNTYYVFVLMFISLLKTYFKTLLIPFSTAVKLPMTLMSCTSCIWALT